MVPLFTACASQDVDPLIPICTKQPEVSIYDACQDFTFENFVVSHEYMATEVIMKLIITQLLI